MSLGGAANVYSRQWFEFFHVGIDDARTAQEAAFVSHCARLPEFQKIADVCCGMGRHARALSARGYSVVGVERDHDAIAEARKLGGGPTYVQADIRDYSPKPGGFDAAIVMSQSFGYFDATTNLNVLRRLATGVRQGGRVVLDLWSEEFFIAHQGERDIPTSRGLVRESKRVDGGRLFVRLDYPDDGQDRFEWQLFSPAQMSAFARSAGLKLVLSCTDFDAATPPSPIKPRLQFLFEVG